MEELTNKEIEDLYAEHEAEIREVWNEMPGGTMRQAVSEWLLRQCGDEA